MKTTVHWKKIGQRAHHGIIVPLFSLHSRKGGPNGEFPDLIPLIDWCKKVGFDLIQLLPIQDSYEDPSPYNPISSCALNPIYLRVNSLTKNKTKTRLDYRQAKQEKMALLQDHFEEHFQDLSKKDPYQSFLKSQSWLDPYALFLTIKEEQGKRGWTEWPLSEQTVPQEISKERQRKVDFYRFVQFLCFEQMKQVHQYALEKGVFLQGDLPILMSPDSADVWENPSFFRLDLAAGAPPDAYSQEGQKWGFPLFQWDAMRQDGFSWIKRRLQGLEPFFDLYRIDHVVGLFRIWGIPKEKKALEGSFFPSDPSLWWNLGKEILSKMLEFSPLLPIAEDLGTIPNEVPLILKDLGICGTKVLRWERRFATDGAYIPFSEYPPLSVSTLSTPDSDVLAGWWKNKPEEASLFAKSKGWIYSPELSSEIRLCILKEIHHTPSYFHVNLLQEYLALFPELVAITPEEERINIPGTVLASNWTYRFRPSIEEIIEHKPLQAKIQEILLSS